MIYRCKCKNYVDSQKDDYCQICGAKVMKTKEFILAPEYGPSDKDGAVRQIERYSGFWDSGLWGVGKYSEEMSSRSQPKPMMCGDYLYLLGEEGIYKFDVKEHLKAGKNALTADALLPNPADLVPEFLGETRYQDLKWGVNREGLWIVCDKGETTKAALFDEQGIPRGKAALTITGSQDRWKLQCIYGSKLYCTDEDGSVVQCGILDKSAKRVWNFRKEPWYCELEKIRKARGLAEAKYEISFHGVAVNENYLVVSYSAYCKEETNSCISYIEGTQKMGEEGSWDFDDHNYNVSCSDLHTGGQTLLYGGERWRIDRDEETVINAEFLYGPFKKVINRDTYGETVIDAQGQCCIVGMDMVSDEVFFLWREGENGNWGKTIYSASIRDFLLRRVEENMRLCWNLEREYASGVFGNYFYGEYLLMENRDNRGNPGMKILGRDGSRADLTYVDDRDSCYAKECTIGGWIWGGGSGVLYDGCLAEYRERDDDYMLAAIDTRPFSAKRCLHIKRGEFLKTRADLKIVRDHGGKPEGTAAESGGEEAMRIPAESDVRDSSVGDTSSTLLEYWAGFASYAERFGLNPAMAMAKLAERTWQTLRIKPSFLRIECSFSVRKNILRATFIVEKRPEVFAQAESARREIDRELQGYEVTWDSKSDAANISLTTSREGMSTSEQYDWFCRAAEALYSAVRMRLTVSSAG